MTIEYKQALTELNTILNYMDSNLTRRIPSKLIKFIKQNMDLQYKPNINPDIPINEQILKNDTKVMLSLIYRDYLVDSEKKKELIKRDLLNKQKYEEQLMQKYNPDNLFKNKVERKNAVDTVKIEHKELTEYKEQRWYQKIFTKILNIFRKK